MGPAYSCTPESFAQWDGKDLANLNTQLFSHADPTIRECLHIIANKELEDLLIGKAAHEIAKTAHPNKYNNYIRKTDCVNEAQLRIPNALKKFHAISDALIALADEGLRPSPTTLREGIEVMQVLRSRNKAIQVGSLAPSLDVETLEKEYYRGQRMKIIKLREDGESLPEYIPPSTIVQIDRYMDMRRKHTLSEEDARPIKNEIDQLVRKHAPYQGEGLKRQFNERTHTAQIRAEETGAQGDLLFHLIQMTRGLMKDLSMDTRTLGKDPE